MKKLISILLIIALCMSLAACSVSTDSSSAAPSQSAAEPAGDGEGDDVEEVPATDYPTKPIDMIIPYGAGGTTDIYGRFLAAQLEKYLGQSITVNNQGGASGAIGAQFVYDAPSDGYTLLMTAEAMGTYRTMGTSELGYDDFTPIFPIVGDPKVIVVGADSPYDTIEDLMEAIAANPGKLTMSHSGPGGSGHNQGLVFKEFGYDVAMTSFDSGNEALLGVLGGQVDFTNPNISTLGGYIESGEVKALAVFADERMESYPDIPAFTESYPDFEKYLGIPYTALTLLVKNDVDDAVVQVLKDACLEVFADPEWEQFVYDNSAEKLYEKYQTPEQIDQFYKNWQSIVCWLQYDNGVAEISPEEYGIERIA